MASLVMNFIKKPWFLHWIFLMTLMFYQGNNSFIYRDLEIELCTLHCLFLYVWYCYFTMEGSMLIYGQYTYTFTCLHSTWKYLKTEKHVHFTWLQRIEQEPHPIEEDSEIETTSEVEYGWSINCRSYEK